MRPPRPQSSRAGVERGATLLITLIMLVVLTLFVISAINISNVGMKVVGNMQARKGAEAAAQLAIEQVLNNMSAFTAPGTTLSLTVAGLPVTVAPRVCLHADAASGYSAAQPIVPEDTVWNVQVSVNDTSTGATTVMSQGVKVRMLAGNCPS